MSDPQPVDAPTALTVGADGLLSSPGGTAGDAAPDVVLGVQEGPTLADPVVPPEPEPVLEPAPDPEPVVAEPVAPATPPDPEPAVAPDPAPGGEAPTSTPEV